MGLLVKDILKIGEERLRQAGVQDFKTDAELLFCFSYHVDRTGLFLNWGKNVDDGNCEQYFSLLDVRCTGVPLQYITGHQEFMGFDFEVNEDVLIPRQDTEILAETAVEMIKENKKVKRVLDLCTGSGAIGISLAKLTGAEVTASDISEKALAVAKRNAAKNNAKVSFACGDLFVPFRRKLGRTRFDMIVSNPPYIPSAEIEELQTEVRDHEPRIALDGGGDGLDFYRKIVTEAPDFLRKSGTLLLEIGCDQAEPISQLAAAADRYEPARVIQDLAGLDRVLLIPLKA